MEVRTILYVYIIRGVSYNKNLSIGRFALTVSEEYNIGVRAIAQKCEKGMVWKDEEDKS